jgi:hypothetical protein
MADGPRQVNNCVKDILKDLKHFAVATDSEYGGVHASRHSPPLLVDLFASFFSVAPTCDPNSRNKHNHRNHTEFAKLVSTQPSKNRQFGERKKPWDSMGEDTRVDGIL